MYSMYLSQLDNISNAFSNRTFAKSVILNMKVFVFFHIF